MKSKKKLWSMCFIGLIAILSWQCAGSAGADQDDETMQLLLLGAGYQNSLNLAIVGNWFFYNSTPSYAGGGGNDAGTVKQGPYTITNSQYSQTYSAFSSTTEGDIVYHDNSQTVFYYKQTSDGANKNKFIWVKWTVNDGHTYVCPDLNGAAATLEESKTEYASVYANPAAGIANHNNIATGCSDQFGGVFWSRLENN